MKINDMPGGVIYIEDAFPNAKKFIDEIENNNLNEKISSVIPPWTKWVDGQAVRLDPNDPTKWDHYFPDDEHSHRGISKLFEWDMDINEKNSIWPRKLVDENYSEAHRESFKIIKLIEDDYLKALEVWYEKTGNSKLDYITRNYCLRKYRTGGSMGPHVDRNVENPKNTMDWTALIYLNDDYEGGEIVFDELGYKIKPSAGSILFLPCLARHSVNEITQGNKYYIFLFIHTEYGTSTALAEPYHSMNDAIIEYRKKLI